MIYEVDYLKLDCTFIYEMRALKIRAVSDAEFSL
jgi:hypothetical protein